MKNLEKTCNGAKSMVMQTLFSSKVQKDRKKECSLMRKEKHKEKHKGKNIEY